MFFKIKTIEEVFDIIESFGSLDEENIPLEDSLTRILRKDIHSPENLPGFARSSMDGFAVKAKDTFGANESLPAFLEIVGEVIMGEEPQISIDQGQAIKISTGGMMPKGSDSVIMVEYCHLLDQSTIEISKAITPGENVIGESDDYREGEIVLKKGYELKAQDIGVLAGLGISEVSVTKKPIISIISTGDEVIPINEKPNHGQVRDINSYTLSGFCRDNGGISIISGLCGDSFEGLREKIEKGIRGSDMVWISGGSSVGTRDLTLKVFESFNDVEILAHGISISPGKPTIIAKIGSCIVCGLPGHTASALVVAEIILKPLIAVLSGRENEISQLYNCIDAKVTRNIESASGRDDFIRVRLKRVHNEWIAEPIFGKSGLISTLVEADGLMRIDRNSEGLYQDQVVPVIMIR